MWNWVGHTLRIPNEAIANSSQGLRKRSRPSELITIDEAMRLEEKIE